MLKNQKAFTLIELMVTIAVMGVVMLIALPAYNQTVINNRSASTAEEFADALKYARAEAMKTSNTITLCPLDKKDVANETDDVCGTDWHTGWIVIKDTAVLVTDAPVVADNDAILRRWPATDTKMQYNFTPSRTYVRFASLGVLSRDKGTNNAEIIAYFEKCKGAAARTITVGLSGLIRVESTQCPAL
jgi:type IV fimbrial biogenesis protein FimT